MFIITETKRAFPKPDIDFGNLQFYVKSIKIEKHSNVVQMFVMSNWVGYVFELEQDTDNLGLYEDDLPLKGTHIFYQYKEQFKQLLKFYLQQIEE
jgi:hypothetical protein